MIPANLPLHGACLCGQVHIHLSAQPLLTFACHCRDCQKLSASAFSLTAMFPSDGFMHTGEVVLGGQRHETRQHYFCPTCLNFIFSRILGADHRVNVRVGILDDLSWFEPYVELMTEEKQTWASVPAVHSFSRFPETIEDLQHLMESYANHERGT